MCGTKRCPERGKGLGPDVWNFIHGEQRSTGPCMSNRFSADAVGWFGHEVGSPHVSGTLASWADALT